MDRVHPPRRRFPEARYRAVEIECVAAAESIAEETRETSKRDRLVADHEPGGVRIGDADAVADIKRAAVGANLGMKPAVQDEQRPRLGRPTRPEGGAVIGARHDRDTPLAVNGEYPVGEHVEIAGTGAKIDRMALAAGFDIEPDRQPRRVE